MRRVRRHLAAGAVLVLAAVLTCAHVLGEPARDPSGKIRFGGSKPVTRDTGLDLYAELNTTRFADQPVLTYRTQDGELLFALQVQPKLEPVPARPRDVLVLIDTSASQAGGGLTAAVRLAEALVANLGPEDRVAVRTANVRGHDLTRGFQSVAAARAALKPLQAEVPMGALDLKATLTEAAAAFENRAGRQQLVLFLGDGLSVLNPFRPSDLADVAARMVKDEIAFFPVPLGLRPDPAALHGLASNTGGAPIRCQLGDTPEAVVKRALDTLSQPILYPTDVTMPADVAERFPADRLPPLRGDAPTLVLGKLKAPVATLSCAVKGTVAGRPVSASVAHEVPEPDLGHFFLASMVKQWQADRAQPAMIRADRALAFAQQQNQMERAELMAQGEFALGEDKFDVAARLFERALQVEPGNGEAKAMSELARDLRDGRLTKQQLEERNKTRAVKARRGGRGEAVAFQPDKAPPGGAPKPADLGPPAGRDCECHAGPRSAAPAGTARSSAAARAEHRGEKLADVPDHRDRSEQSANRVGRANHHQGR